MPEPAKSLRASVRHDIAWRFPIKTARRFHFERVPNALARQKAKAHPPLQILSSSVSTKLNNKNKNQNRQKSEAKIQPDIIKT